jgi:hypothetical protein
MKPRLMVCTFLVGCFTALALGQQNVEHQWLNKQNVAEAPRKWDFRSPSGVANEEWLAKQSKDLLDIIRILYKGREVELNELEAIQAKMKSEDQIERRIALIKSTLSEKEAK